MEWITRLYEKTVPKLFTRGKVLILYGPRRAGKTCLVQKILSGMTGKIYAATGEDIDLREVLESQKRQTIKLLFSEYDIIFIDEAQYIKDIGLSLKMLVDGLPDKKIIVSGSSSFDISTKISEPLTGRQVVRTLFPVSVSEMKAHVGGMDLYHKLEEILIFGLYPEQLNISGGQSKKEYLHSLKNAYLFKDILALENIKNPSKLIELLKLLAFQIGSEVSINELSRSLGIAKATVERYIDLLEKAFVIKKLGGFSRNLRSEISKTSKYYFIDNGIRNSVINNFNLLSNRDDTGRLWENFIISEFIKKQEYQRIFSNNYFWRTYDKKEIDFVEERDGRLIGYEIKWGPKKVKPPDLWLKTYPDATYKIVNRTNFLEYFSK